MVGAVAMVLSTVIMRKEDYNTFNDEDDDGFNDWNIVDNDGDGRRRVAVAVAVLIVMELKVLTFRTFLSLQ